MRKEGIIYSACGKILDSLNYVVIEHSGIAPSTFVEHLLGDFDLGILLLGIDAPCPLSATQAERIAGGFNEQGIIAIAMGSLIWIQYKESLKLFKEENFDCLGDALILKLKPPEEGFVIPYLPEASGSKRDKLELKDAQLLDGLLCENELYMHDDFTNCLIVTKGERIFGLILDKLGKLGAVF